ncbi:transcriptional regulator [Nocardioides iriomotensis]|uniref:Transcriptional regulator n=1 Tax=Nocardioides iriomotensis TaxID=715784 RepID=A0A4Q5J070_9ACTN|nr:transcriptional regulator [Nocardioides iriomotensis]RYU11897.1 transcriptional regulator [Nocardioides iriomotensis]
MVHVRADELVASALAASDAGVGDAENAAQHGVAVKTIRRWRRLYQRRGRPRGQAHTRVPCPRCGDATLADEAYAELLGWYLGDGWIETSPRGVFTLHIYNDATYTDLNDRVEELLRLVKPGGRPHRRLRNGSCTISVGWNHWPCLLPQHGPGRKHERVLPMEDWQWQVVERRPGDFLRGLFHSDGARVANWATRTVAGETKRYDYARWQFVNRSEQILGWCTDALDLVEVPWRRSGRWTVSVSTRAGVARLDELVGPKS